MKSFIIKTLLCGGILVSLVLAVVLWFPIRPNDYLQAYKLKTRLLEETTSPRIIFVGGSNLAFGLDSQRIKDSLRVNVVNYGLHAGIGMKFMLDDVETYTRKGDVIVIAPEYSHFYTIQYGEAETIAPIQKICGWKKLSLLNLKQLMNVIVGFPRIMEYIRPRNYDERSYALSGFNQYGDEVKHWKLESIAISKPGPINASLDVSFGKYFIEKIEALEREKECTVYIVPPVCMGSAFKAMEKSVREVADFLKKNGHPFLVSPDSHALPDEYAFDTSYHMSYEGVKRYTSSMIEILKKH